jgi:hypothetical protein
MATMANDPKAVREAQERWLADRESESAPAHSGAGQAVSISTAVAPLTFWRIALAVMTGNLLAGLIGGLLYLAVR